MQQKIQECCKLKCLSPSCDSNCWRGDSAYLLGMACELSRSAQRDTLILSCDILCFSSDGILLTGGISVEMAGMLIASIQSSHSQKIWQWLNSLYSHLYGMGWSVRYTSSNFKKENTYQYIIKQISISVRNSFKKFSFSTNLFCYIAWKIFWIIVSNTRRS